MAKTTTNYNLSKPEITDAVDIEVINANMDKIDTQMFVNATNLIALVGMFANEYDNSSTYELGALCTHEFKMYKCISPIEESEEWTGEHWSKTTLSEELAAILSQINSEEGGI